MKIKKYLVIFLCLLCFMSILTGCKTQPIDDDINTPPVKNPDISSTTDEAPSTIDEFNTEPIANKYEAIETILDNLYEGENIMYSPLSFDCALGMISNSANDDVKKDLETYFGTTIENNNNFFEEIIDNNDDVLKIANAIWVKNNFSLNEEFFNIVKDKFDAECKTLPFDETFVNTINNWCAEKTNNLITNLLDTTPPEETETILTNALYFKGEWEKEYTESDINPTDFIKADNSTVKTEGMYGTENIYFENDNATGFMKYYKSKKYAFIGILPKKEGDFSFSDINIETLLQNKTNEKVFTMIPKFSFETSNTLTNQLNNIGLGRTLVDGAFPHLTNETSLKIDTILQKTIIKVDTKGTEASAVTGIMLESGSIATVKTKEVLLNRPFAFVIYDVENNLPIFVGKVVNPIQ